MKQDNYRPVSPIDIMQSDVVDFDELALGRRVRFSPPRTRTVEKRGGHQCCGYKTAGCPAAPEDG